MQVGDQRRQVVGALPGQQPGEAELVGAALDVRVVVVVEQLHDVVLRLREGRALGGAVADRARRRSG